MITPGERPGEFRFHIAVDKALELCRKEKRVSLAQVEKLAEEYAIRPSAILDELAITEGVTIDYEKGIIICQ